MGVGRFQGCKKGFDGRRCDGSTIIWRWGACTLSVTIYPQINSPESWNFMQFADRLKNVETSAIRELFKLLVKPGIISFAGGFPDPTLFDAEGIKESSNAVLTNTPGPVLQYGATEGYQPLRDAISTFMANKGATAAPDGLIVTTGS